MDIYIDVHPLFKKNEELANYVLHHENDMVKYSWK